MMLIEASTVGSFAFNLFIRLHDVVQMLPIVFCDIS